jgi:phosphoribosylamine--glycine ligase
LLKSDLYELCQATVNGKLEGHQLEFEEGSCICVVMASGGYPANYTTGYPIKGLKEAAKLPNVMLFHAGTKKEKGKVVTSGGRVLGITAWGENLEQARDLAYQAVRKINFEGAYYRSDIGYKGLARYEPLNDKEKR